MDIQPDRKTEATQTSGKAPVADSCEYAALAPKESCTIIIFGASGDLTTRKLIPAIFNLFVNASLPESFSIVGCSRTPLDRKSFIEMLGNKYPAKNDDKQNQWDNFADNLYYQQITYDNSSSYKDFASFLRKLDEKKQTQGNRIFYLAVPPTLYPIIAEMIGSAGLAHEYTDNNGWVRIVVEKPFGRDLTTALELERILHNSFEEHQIFRIDHYLAKETVQNILMLRFANTIFEPLWNRSYIDYIGIVAAEHLGVEHRAGYYEQSGVIRDMFQNHLMQLLALTAMEPPSNFEAARVQDEKVKIFRSLKPLSFENIQKNLILGQYDKGKRKNGQLSAYRQEPDVDPASRTPTFAAMRIFIDNWRWRDVPFYLISGKRLRRKETKIIIQFKKVPHSMFRNVLEEKIIANRLIMGVFPREEISLTFQTKSPGAKDCLRPVTMDFRYDQNFSGPILGAYEKVLLDCLKGDHMLFWRQDGVELSWSFLTPILKECEVCEADSRDIDLYPYPSGSWGPIQAHKWTQLILD